VIFLRKEEIIELQHRAIEAHGGIHGLRDEGLLESAVLAPENRHYYEGADVVGCAAAYAFNIAKAHAFLDGNKRIAHVATKTFLLFNGTEIVATQQQMHKFYLSIAAGEMSRDEVEDWLRAHTRAAQ
jgi:death on curing protein